MSILLTTFQNGLDVVEHIWDPAHGSGWGLRIPPDLICQQCVVYWWCDSGTLWQYTYTCVEMVWQYIQCILHVQCSDIGWQWNDLTILLSHWPFPLCADNQTLSHNQNILSQPQVQYTTQYNQISRTQNITKQHPRNKNQTKPTLLGLRQDWIVIREAKPAFAAFLQHEGIICDGQGK